MTEKADSGRPGGHDGSAYLVRGERIRAPSLAPALYVVATPIGNLSDVTIRALDVLAAADLVACEDTRVTRKLMSRYGISAKLISYNDYSDERKRERIVAAVAGGEAVALVSDAGTPLISDPGYRLVAAIREAGLPVVPVPGASSLMAALAGAGLPTDRFHFVGFPAAKAGARRRELAELTTLTGTLALMESPNRLAATLADAADLFGSETEACVCREMTKLHETFDRGTLLELAERYRNEAVKGEVVLLIHARGDGEAAPSEEEVDRLLREALVAGPVRQAADRVAAATGLSRRMLYQRALQLKESQSDSKES
jgi:16S rRNA (cytidine1402-2'-O)-methyltransferase